MSRRPNTPPTDADIEHLLRDSPQEARAAFVALRALIHDTLDGMSERYLPGWGAVGFHHPHAGYMVGLFVRANEILVLFEHGAELPDPEGLLTGSQKQTRQIPIRRVEVIPENGLRALLHAAAAWGRR
ncbi:MAG: DUF1801 domain-containing protein [Chloroflexi bacterium]|nr:DUF1801 domain-containing protein [Chloroflexota bacterium]